MVKCTVKLPEPLWLSARTRALEEKRDFQDMVAAALADYLAKAKKGGPR